LNVLVLLEQGVIFPLIAPGVAGMEFTVMANVCTGDEPQVLLAVTVTFPLVEPESAVIVLVVDVPVHPVGNVHV
jgi:hypothetical protein